MDLRPKAKRWNISKGQRDHLDSLAICKTSLEPERFYDADKERALHNSENLKKFVEPWANLHTNDQQEAVKWKIVETERVRDSWKG